MQEEADVNVVQSAMPLLRQSSDMETDSNEI